GYPFEIVEGLIYNINLINKKRRLYVPKGIVPMILNIVYNEKYYFGRDCIIYNFKDYIIIKKMYEIKEYL
ncbi:hypothetical protein GE21DRAFT_1209029, partial [Neurospora crassa]